MKIAITKKMFKVKRDLDSQVKDIQEEGYVLKEVIDNNSTKMKG